MPRKNIITFSFGRGEFSAEAVPLKRKSIYGERKIIALDKENHECKRILYDESDMTLFPKKTIGTCRLNEEGKIYSKAPDESKTGSEYRRDEKDWYIFEELTEDSLFLEPIEAQEVYTLQGYDVLTVVRLIGERIFQYKCGDLLFQRNGTVFLVKRKRGLGYGTYAEKNTDYQPDDEPIVSDINSVDDIDFDMF